MAFEALHTQPLFTAPNLFENIRALVPFHTHQASAVSFPPCPGTWPSTHTRTTGFEVLPGLQTRLQWPRSLCSRPPCTGQCLAHGGGEVGEHGMDNVSRDGGIGPSKCPKPSVTAKELLSVPLTTQKGEGNSYQY